MAVSSAFKPMKLQGHMKSRTHVMAIGETMHGTNSTVTLPGAKDLDDDLEPKPVTQTLVPPF
jgi:hypothetical protein